jgi:MoxR-like ATPase
VSEATAEVRQKVELFAGGHVLLEGVPGIGKTLLVRRWSEALQLWTSRGSSSRPT